jgi:hypothetical protein
MTEPEAKEAKQTRGKRFLRRGFLTGLGAGGLTAASAIFGSEPAAAASCGCCFLTHCPPNTDMGSCRSYSDHYVWSCSVNNYLWCSCCEDHTPYGTNWASAYSCQYG